MNYYDHKIEKEISIGRKKPRQGRSEYTVGIILDAAIRILKKDGYAKLNTNLVAEVAGVSIGTLYQYFQNKEAIVSAVWDRLSREMRELTMEKMSDVYHLSLSRILKEMISYIVEAHRIDIKLHKILLTEVPQVELYYINKRAENENCQALRELILFKKDEVRENLDIDLALRLIHALIENIIHNGVVSNTEILHSDQLIDEMHYMVMAYLEPES